MRANPILSLRSGADGVLAVFGTVVCRQEREENLLFILDWREGVGWRAQGRMSRGRRSGGVFTWTQTSDSPVYTNAQSSESDLWVHTMPC